MLNWSPVLSVDFRQLYLSCSGVFPTPVIPWLLSVVSWVKRAVWDPACVSLLCLVLGQVIESQLFVLGFHEEDCLFLYSYYEPVNLLSNYLKDNMLSVSYSKNPLLLHFEVCVWVPVLVVPLSFWLYSKALWHRCGSLNFCNVEGWKSSPPCPWLVFFQY